MLDVQSQQPKNRVRIDRVGISDFYIPVKIESNYKVLSTSARFSFSASLRKSERGTHMSRLILILHEFQDLLFDYDTLIKISDEAKMRLKSTSSVLSLEFDYFVQKQSPVTKINNIVNYKASMVIKNDHNVKVCLKIIVPITSVCPCSKEISDRGAHSQRGEVTIEADITNKKQLWFTELIKAVESAASTEIYSVLKRSDEKFVTEFAYQNALFVEDIVRTIDKKMMELAIKNYSITCKNYESIHNHNAFAQIKKGEICI